MQTLILSGRTRHGRNRIREHGDEWELLEARDAVPALRVAGFSVRSVATGATRWIAQHDDRDFNIVAISI